LPVVPFGRDRATSFRDDIMTMTIRIGEETCHVTETELRDLILRFEVRSDGTARQYLVDGVEVTEAVYRREFEKATTRQVA
jgi:hypothetical protein